MKVVKDEQGNILYRQVPDFEEGKGILNAVFIHGRKAEGLAEVEISEAEFESASVVGIVRMT